MSGPVLPTYDPTLIDNAGFRLDHPPSQRELDIFLASVRYGTSKAAGDVLGISEITVRSALSRVYRKIGAKHDAHAVALLWPVLRDRYVIPGDRLV